MSSFTRGCVASSALRRCLIGVVVTNLANGCVRELTGLTFEALPGEAGIAASDGALAAINDAGALDAASDGASVFDASTVDATPIGRAHVDADVAFDSGVSSAELDASDVMLPALDAANGASSTPPTNVRDGDVKDAAVDAEVTTIGERSVFQAAGQLVNGDAGLGLVPIFPARELVVDGSNLDWTDDGWLWIATPDPSIGAPHSERDLSAALALRWDATTLYLVVTVVDDRHVNDASGFDIWAGDSIQVAFDVGQGRLPYDWEYGFANTAAGATAHRWREGDADLTSDLEFAVVRHAAATVYEVAFEARHLGVQSFPTDTLRMSVAVNDNDDHERSAALELVQGIVGSKSAAHFAAAEWR